MEICWFGGEPLLAMDVIENISKEVINICKKLKKLYNASITTNGFLLTPKNIEILLKNRVTNFTVTLDGLSECHDTLRVLKSGNPTHSVILKNLLYIKNNILKSNLRIFVRTNITKTIGESLEKYYNFGEKEGQM